LILLSSMLRFARSFLLKFLTFHPFTFKIWQILRCWPTRYIACQNFFFSMGIVALYFFSSYPDPWLFWHAPGFKCVVLFSKNSSEPIAGICVTYKPPRPARREDGSLITAGLYILHNNWIRPDKKVDTPVYVQQPFSIFFFQTLFLIWIHSFVSVSSSSIIHIYYHRLTGKIQKKTLVCSWAFIKDRDTHIDERRCSLSWCTASCIEVSTSGRSLRSTVRKVSIAHPDF